MGNPMERLTIDRFEGAFALCEDSSGNMHDLPREAVPSHAKEGDILVLQPDGGYIVDEQATKSRREKVRSLFESLLEDS